MYKRQGYALAYDEENEIVSIQYAEDFQQTDDFSYYSKMVYEILNVVAVSYTHLDVYKRQVSRRLQRPALLVDSQ